MDPRRPDKQQKYKPPPTSNNAAPGEDLTPDYMNILDSPQKNSLHKYSDRFKVVKIESTEPFKRGRWECMDFLDQSYDRMAHYNSVLFKASETNLNQSALVPENADNNFDSHGSMLQIFHQQNSSIDTDRKKSRVFSQNNCISYCDNYIQNENGNFILLPGMVSTSLIGIKYPFELNFLPISTKTETVILNDNSECEFTSIQPHVSAESILNNNVPEQYETINNFNSFAENQVAKSKTNISCQIFDSQQMSIEPKMSAGNIHYIQQNGEIQSAQESRIKNNSDQLNHEVFNNYNTAGNMNVPVNPNVVMQNISQNPNGNSDVKNVYQSNTMQEQNRQKNQDTKLTSNIHYMQQQNNDLQNTQENRMKNTQEQLNHEVFNNYSTTNNLSSNVVLQNPGGSTDVNNVYQNNSISEQIPKEIIDSQNYKQTIINPNNSIQNSVPNVVYQQQRYTNDIAQQQEYKNLSQNNCSNVADTSIRNVTNISDANVCNVPNIPNQNFSPEVHQNITYQPVSDIKPQIINKPVNNNICQPVGSNLTIRTQAYDVMPEVKTQNQGIYNSNLNTIYSQPVNPSVVNSSPNKAEFDQNYTSTHRIHEEVQYNCQQTPKKYAETTNTNFDMQNQNKTMVQGNYYPDYQQESRPVQKNISVNTMQMDYTETGQNDRKPNFVPNEQIYPQKTDVNFQKNPEKGIQQSIKEEFSNMNNCSRPTSAKFGCDPDQKLRDANKFGNSNSSQQFAFVPEVDINSQSSINFNQNNVNPNSSNIGLNQLNTPGENGAVFMDQTQFFMPAYPFNQAPYTQNPIYIPVFSNTVQIPLCVNSQTSNPTLCEQVVSETALNRKPIGYQRVWIPQNNNPNIVRRSNQFYYQNPNQTGSNRSQTDVLTFEPVYGNNEGSPRSEAYMSSIDVKIEALMDLVKKHLKFTIMEDVHSLKQRILNLKERVAQLEYENELLRSHTDKKFKDKL